MWSLITDSFQSNNNFLVVKKWQMQLNGFWTLSVFQRGGGAPSKTKWSRRRHRKNFFCPKNELFYLKFVKWYIELHCKVNLFYYSIIYNNPSLRPCLIHTWSGKAFNQAFTYRYMAFNHDYYHYYYCFYQSTYTHTQWK